MTDDTNVLGDYLRARRELVTPDAVGIPVLSSRRVAGLRREEVAMLAGISAEYYLRLEQGRDRHPSAQVLRSIARVLQLDDDGYLLGLVAEPKRTQHSRQRRETAPATTSRLVAALPFPAFIEGRYLDVLAANPLAGALSPCLVVGRNRLRDVFLDESERALFPDPRGAATALLAGFRRSIGTSVADPRVIDLVGELSLASQEFRTLWARHDVGPRTGAVLTLDHPQVGELKLDREKLAVTGTDGAMLVIYHPSPDTDSAEKLAFLASFHTPNTVSQDDPGVVPVANRHPGHNRARPTAE